MEKYLSGQFLAALILFITPTTFSQTTDLPCGVPDLSTQQINDMLNSNSNGSTAGGIITTDGVVELPLHIYIIEDANRNLPTALPSVDPVYSMVDYINNRFSHPVDMDAKYPDVPEFSFFICEVTVVENASAYYDFEYDDDVAGLYDLVHDDEAINFYIVNSLTQNQLAFRGFGRMPVNQYANNFVIVRSEEVSGDSWVPAHELGHHFGLLHTFAGTSSPAGLQVSGNEPACFNSGDLICDTNPDPYKNDPNNPANNRCLEGCNVAACDWDWQFPPQTFTFFPPKDNIMSYYDCASPVFTRDQFNRMFEMLEENEYRAFLRDNVEASCVVPELPVGKLLVTNDAINFSAVEGLDIDPLNNLTSGSCSILTSDMSGEFQLTSCFPSPATVDASFFNPGNSAANSAVQKLTNGVTTLDILLGTKHILGVEELDSPFKKIAADVNGSGTITTLDMVQMRQVILGIVDNFPSQTPSWRLLPQHYLSSAFNFSTGFFLNPFDVQNQVSGHAYPNYLDQFDIMISASDPAFSNSETWSFIAIKMGDLNGNAVLSSSGNPNFGGSSVQNLTGGNSNFAFNEWDMIEVEFQVKQSTQPFDLSAYQLELQFDPQMVELSAVVPLSGGLHPVNEDIYCLEKDACIARLLWFTTDQNYPFINFYNKNLFGVRLLAKSNLNAMIDDLVQLNTSDFKAQFFDENGVLQPVKLTVDTRPIFSNILSAYPNPGTNQVTLEIPISENGTDVRVRLYQWNSSNDDTYFFSNQSQGILVQAFDISNFNSGNYIARVCLTPPGQSENCDNDTLVKF